MPNWHIVVKTRKWQFSDLLALVLKRPKISGSVLSSQNCSCLVVSRERGGVQKATLAEMSTFEPKCSCESFGFRSPINSVTRDGVCEWVRRQLTQAPGVTSVLRCVWRACCNSSGTSSLCMRHVRVVGANARYIITDSRRFATNNQR